MKKNAFMDTFIAHSGAYGGRPDIDKGNKSNSLISSHILVILPPSALTRLTQMTVSSPFLFRMTAPSKMRKTFCGLLEFVAEEECCYLPGWVRELLRADDAKHASG